MKTNPNLNQTKMSPEERNKLTSKLLPGVSRTPYTEFLERIIREGEWVFNKRTGKNCLTIIDHNFEYDVENNKLPLDTTRQSYARQAIMEFVGYLRGYTSAAQFRAIGVNTWDENTNESENWLKNPHRKGKDDMGGAYGQQLRAWLCPNGETVDQLRMVFEKLELADDDRGLILNFLNPGVYKTSSLRPCLYAHQFSILGGKLFLNSTQRSCDGPLGGNFNQVQCFFALKAMSLMTGIPPGRAFHKIVNGHIYEDQIETVLEQLNNEPYDLPSLEISDKLDNLDYLLNEFTPDDFEIIGYRSHKKINHTFAK